MFMINIIFVIAYIQIYDFILIFEKNNFIYALLYQEFNI